MTTNSPGFLPASAFAVAGSPPGYIASGTPDAFRLSSSGIPNALAVAACMRKNRSKLSAASKTTFPR